MSGVVLLILVIAAVLSIVGGLMLVILMSRGPSRHNSRPGRGQRWG